MQLSPSDWFNFNGDFKIIFEGDKSVSNLSDNEYIGTDTATMSTGLIFKNIPGHGLVEVKKNNNWNIPIGITTKFQLLTEIRFKSDWYSAICFVSYYLIGIKSPYIRVGTDYYKVITKTDRYGVEQTSLKLWSKGEILQDHGKGMYSLIPKYDDFTIEPNNKQHLPAIGNNYNLYAKFPHVSFNGEVTESDIPVTMNLIKHVFGSSPEEVELGLRYFKVLYEYPRQMLPILSLVSVERETGKTTFINWVSMLFGANSVLISPEDVSKNHNSLYANKNIIMVDETVIEKSASVEKVKSLATAKQISVDPKFVQQYQIPFFGKIILCTNKEKDFMRIDNEEIRFWVRKVNPIKGKKNAKIEEQLKDEIPKFLKYLEQQPAINFDNGSRMIFTADEIQTNALQVVKAESKSSLGKELEEYIFQHCMTNQITKFGATAIEIKNKWFSHNNNINVSYIRKVLKEELKINQSEKQMRYDSFGIISLNPLDKANGFPFLFEIEGIKIDKDEAPY